MNIIRARASKMSNVDHPKHYNMGKIEVIDAIEDWKLGFNEGNAIKYVARAKHKGREIEDLEKAKWYRAILQAKIADFDARVSSEAVKAKKPNPPKPALPRTKKGPSSGLDSTGGPPLGRRRAPRRRGA